MVLSAVREAFLAALPDEMPTAGQILSLLPEDEGVGLNIDEAGQIVASSEDKPAEDEDDSDLMTIDEWCAQFTVYHYMGGALVGAGEPLGDQAASEGGQEASKASYRLIRRFPFLKRQFLKKGSGVLVDLAAVAFHAMACRNIVAVAIANRPSKQRGAASE